MKIWTDETCERRVEWNKKSQNESFAFSKYKLNVLVIVFALIKTNIQFVIQWINFENVEKPRANVDIVRQWQRAMTREEWEKEQLKSFAIDIIQVELWMQRDENKWEHEKPKKLLPLIYGRHQ